MQPEASCVYLGINQIAFNVETVSEFATVTHSELFNEEATAEHTEEF